MDPAGVEQPACEECGATERLIQTHHAGWFCLDEIACNSRVWLKQKRELDEAMAEMERADLHPTGRCTCGGEGRCAWCSRPCPACGVPTIEHGDTCISTQRGCSRCGGLENVLLLHYGWVCDFCLGGDRMPDYEALGYPETEAREANLDAYYVVAGNIVTLAAYWAGGYGDSLEAAEKDIPSPTDIVDSGATDSYK